MSCSLSGTARIARVVTSGPRRGRVQNKIILCIRTVHTYIYTLFNFCNSVTALISATPLAKFLLPCSVLRAETVWVLNSLSVKCQWFRHRVFFCAPRTIIVAHDLHDELRVYSFQNDSLFQDHHTLCQNNLMYFYLDSSLWFKFSGISNRSLL